MTVVEPQYLARSTLDGQAAALFRRGAGRRHPLSLGQIGIGADGKLPDGIEAQTRQALENIGAVLKRAGLGFGDVFHCTVMLARHEHWPAFNKVYRRPISSEPLPARSAFGASGLALGGLVELECQAYAGRSRSPRRGPYFGIDSGVYLTRVTFSFSPLSLVVTIE